jgi:hypothetical protein
MGRSPGIATSSSTARDPTKRPAPGWRCYCEPKESSGSARLKAGSTPGSRSILHPLPEASSRTRCSLREGIFFHPLLPPKIAMFKIQGLTPWRVNSLKLNQEEVEKWKEAQAQAEAHGTFFMAWPHYCAVGTKSK